MADGRFYPLMDVAAGAARRFTVVPVRSSQREAELSFYLEQADAACRFLFLTALLIEGLAPDESLEIRVTLDANLVFTAAGAAVHAAQRTTIRLPRRIPRGRCEELELADPVRSVWDVIRSGILQARPGRFNPRTSVAAMKAFDAGLLPPEVFVSLSVGRRPINVEPYDLEDLRQLLARKDLPLDTRLLLLEVFRILVQHKDAEVALFAAEGISTLEGQVTDRIETLRSQEFPPGPAADQRTMEMTRLYHELSRMNQHSPAIAGFYRWEAYAALQEVGDYAGLQRDDFILLVRIVVELELYDFALYLLAERTQQDPSLRFLDAEIRFRQHRFLEVATTLHELVEQDVGLGPQERHLAHYWLSEKSDE